ncbi:MAG TPA: hypothetical protein VKV69_06205 [Actinomycetota bacterium]|nr:hypothetical protein [Actinomycetota bacterium]
MKRLADAVVPLTFAAFVMDLVHDLDHIRRHNYSPVAVRSLGFFALAAGILAVTLVARRSKLAVPFACFYGLASGLGLFAVHVLPHWSLFSDPLTTYHVDALSWTIVAVTIAVDLALGIGAGLRLVGATSRPLEARAAL